MRALAGLLLVVAQAASSQPRVAIPGTSVALDPPPGFELAEGFAGLAHPASGASVQVAQLRATTLDELRPILHPDSLLAQGYVSASLRDSTASGVPALWSSGVQRERGRSVAKRSLAVRAPDGVVLLSASVPVDAPGVLADVERLLATFEPPAAGPPDPFAELPFAAALPAELPDAQRRGRSVLAANRPPYPDGRARLILGAENGPAVGDGRSLVDVAISRLEATLGTSLVVREISTREVRLAGRPAVEAVAEAANASSGDARMIYVAVVPDDEPGAYVVAHGLAAGPHGALWLERFRSAAASIRWTR